MTKRTIITDYEILRDVVPNGLTRLDCPRGTPLQIATLLDEAHFLEHKVLVHHKNVFLEDRIHDWNVSGTVLRYYSRVRTSTEVGNDILLVYGREDREDSPKFCHMTGKPLNKETKNG